MYITIKDKRDTRLNAAQLSEQVLMPLGKWDFTIIEREDGVLLSTAGDGARTRHLFARLQRLLPVLGLTATVETSLAEARSLMRPNPLVFHAHGRYRV